MYNLICIAMLIVLNFGYVSGRKKQGIHRQARKGSQWLAGAWKRRKNGSLQRCASADRMAELSVFAHFRTGGFLHEKDYRPGFDADHVSISDY